MTQSISNKARTPLVAVLLAATFVSACSSTPQSAGNSNISPNTNSYYQSIDSGCEQDALDRDSFAQQSGQEVQYLASAKALQRCVQGIQFPKGHPQADQGLRLMALAVMNFVKGGDLHAANTTLRKIQSRFPNQDLYFADYSSFLDTATALLNQKNLSSQKLITLNISPTLRAELERNQYWLSH
jgi:hypothetical protein